MTQDTQPEMGSRVSVRVDTPDKGAEVFLLDGRLRVVARGVGALQAEVFPGVYKVKVQAGQTVDERLILAKQETVWVSLGALNLATPAPLLNTVRTPKELMEAAEQTSLQTQLTLGEGSRLFVFARGSAADRDIPPAGQNPAEGLALYNAAGEKLVDLARQSVRGESGEPYAACGAMLAPGCYRLGVSFPEGTLFEQMVVTSPGWSTNIFLQQSRIRPETEYRPDLAGASISMEPLQFGFLRGDEQMRLVETARMALMNRRAVVEGELKTYLHEKFNDPILGILAGHLVLGRRPLDKALIEEVVGNLRRMVGTQPHPDVEALALAAGMPVEYDFATPPMLRRSWAVIVEASAAHRGLTPAGSLANEIAMLITNTDPWLIWQRPTAGISRGLEFSQAVAWLLWPETARRGTPSVGERALRLYTGVIQALMRGVPGLSAKYQVQLGQAIQGLKSEQNMKDVTHRLSLPRAKIEEMLDTFYEKTGANAPRA